MRTAIVFRVILPNALSPIIVLASLMVASAILLESGCRSWAKRST
jgi:peptide/nickel transport system permease protein